MIITNFIMKYKLHGMVTGVVAVEFCDVPQRHSFLCYFLYINTLLVTYKEVKYQLKQCFPMNIKFDELLSEIDNLLQKGEFYLTMSA